MTDNERWKQRFNSFEKSFTVFSRRLKCYQADKESEAEQMALVKSFELIYDLSWKLQKDYLENQGIVDVATPRLAIKQAFKSELIAEGEIWLDAIKNRNLTTHTYDEDTLNEVIFFISEQFYPAVEQLYNHLKNKI